MSEPTEKDPSSAPVIAPLPSEAGRRIAARKRGGPPYGWALVVGVAAGLACYRWVAPVAAYFDYWLARLMS